MSNMFKTQIFEPLGMDDSIMGLPKQDGALAAVGFSQSRAGEERTVYPQIGSRFLKPAAGLSSSVNDMAQFVSWQFRLLGTYGRRDTERGNAK